MSKIKQMTYEDLVELLVSDVFVEVRISKSEFDRLITLGTMPLLESRTQLHARRKQLLFSLDDAETLLTELKTRYQSADTLMRRTISNLAKQLEDQIPHQRRNLEALATDVPREPPPPTDEIFQIKITLQYTSVMRRIQVPDCLLADLRFMIHACFKWDDEHLHEFVIEAGHYGSDLDDSLNSSDYRLSELVKPKRSDSNWHYIYDFGDNWDHLLKFETFKPVPGNSSYPICIASEGQAPEENSRGWSDKPQKIDRPESYSPATLSKEMLKIAWE